MELTQINMDSIMGIKFADVNELHNYHEKTFAQTIQLWHHDC